MADEKQTTQGTDEAKPQKPDMKRDRERAELHKTIWGIANDLRGATGIDGWDFKNYVLGFLFYRYISENIASYIDDNQHRAGRPDFDYASMTDEEIEGLGTSFDRFRNALIKRRGFFILPSQLFCNVRTRAKSDPDLNETIANTFKAIESSAAGTESEDAFRGLFDDIDVNSNRLGANVPDRNRTLVKILDGIAAMNLGNASFSDNSIDAFGDAYEFLMGMYASNAGKSGGEYFTPQEVSRLLMLIATHGRDKVDSIYDPACGSGSLLLQGQKIFGTEDGVGKFYGQEINITTYNLCRINFFLHDTTYDQFDIRCGDTLKNPRHYREGEGPFEVIVSNPPYSIRWEGADNATLAGDERFTPAGALAPKGKADFAFIMHCVASLSESGTAAIVCFPGIFYRGGAEQKIRKYLVDENLVDAIIQLPENLFYGTGIATNILVLSKSKVDDTVTFIDASHECVKVTNNNKLTEENIQTILGWATKRPTEDDDANVKHRVRHVPASEIQGNKYDLTVSTYVEPEDTRPKIDIVKLNAEIARIVAEEERLRNEIDSILSQIDLSKISAYKKDEDDEKADEQGSKSDSADKVEELSEIVPADDDEGGTDGLSPIDGEILPDGGMQTRLF